MQHNVTMKTLGEYSTQCYDKDIGETIKHNVKMKILGDYATKCYDEDIGRLFNTMLR